MKSYLMSTFSSFEGIPIAALGVPFVHGIAVTISQ
jgi:hypothetical protein